MSRFVTAFILVAVILVGSCAAQQRCSQNCIKCTKIRGLRCLSCGIRTYLSEGSCLQGSDSECLLYYVNGQNQVLCKLCPKGRAVRMQTSSTFESALESTTNSNNLLTNEVSKTSKNGLEKANQIKNNFGQTPSNFCFKPHYTVPNGAFYATYQDGTQKVLLCENGTYPNEERNACVFAGRSDAESSLNQQPPIKTDCMWSGRTSSGNPFCFRCKEGFVRDENKLNCRESTVYGCYEQQWRNCVKCDSWNGFMMTRPDSGICTKN